MAPKRPKRHSRKPRKKNKALIRKRKRKRSQPGRPRKRKKRRGPKTLKSQAKMPARASKSTRIQFRTNEGKAKDTMHAYRAGFNACWKYAPKLMRRYNIPENGDFDPTNQHKGRLWAYKRECKITGNQASLILEECHRRGCSEAQLRQIMKTFSYAYFLRTNKSESNFSDVKEMWDSFYSFKAPTRPLLPEKCPTPEQIKLCLMTPWSKTCGMFFYDWLVGLICFWDWAVAGSRHVIELETKLKKSVSHGVDHKHGCCFTDLVAGRPKLCGKKRGTRPWRLHRLCLCPGGKHQNPPELFCTHFDDNGNLKKKPNWHVTCPVAAWQVIESTQRGEGIPKDECKLYKKWLPSTKYTAAGVSKTNIPSVVDRANKWMEAQGAAEGVVFRSSAGRKALGGWLAALGINYRHGFEIHADCFKTWKKSYQPSVTNIERFGDRRTQSTDMDDTLAAYRRLRHWLGVARFQHKLEPKDRLLWMSLKKSGMSKAEIEAVLAGDDGWEDL